MTKRKTYRRGIRPITSRLRNLPIDDRGYPIPFFVATLEDGTRDFRIADKAKYHQCARDELCWICGEKITEYFCFMIGPLSGITREAIEPPGHLLCMQYAATTCPFLTIPYAKYREGYPAVIDAQLEKMHDAMITKNPGVCIIWMTTRGGYQTKHSALGLGFALTRSPNTMIAYAEGKPLQKSDRVIKALDDVVPELIALNKNDPAAIHEIANQHAIFKEQLRMVIDENDSQPIESSGEPGDERSDVIY